MLQSRRAAHTIPLRVLRPACGMRFFRTRSSPDASARATVSHLERLYETAKQTFKDGRPVSESEIATVRKLLDAIPLQEVGLDEFATTPQGGSLRRILSRLGLGVSRPSTITYLHICENKDFCLGIFCFPKGCDIPLHDHPHMTVFSRVLYGKIWAKAYDWPTACKVYLEYGESQPANLTFSERVQAGDPSLILYPRSGGNIHNFKAESNCAVLDLLTPPYDTSDPERNCSYYQEISEGTTGNMVTLRKIPDPGTIQMISSKYTGIQLE